MTVVVDDGTWSDGVTYQQPAPTLASITPNNGPTGTAVTVIGTNFGAAQGVSTLTLGGQNIVVTSWSATSISGTTPALALGAHNLVVTANSQSATLVAAFEVTNPTPATLPTALVDAGAVVIGSWLYVIGGRSSLLSPLSAVTTVQRATITGNAVSAFTTASIAPLPAARYGASVLVANGYIYVFGGRDTAGARRREMYYALPDGSGNIASWSTATAQLPLGGASHLISTASPSASNGPTAVHVMSGGTGNMHIHTWPDSGTGDITFYGNNGDFPGEWGYGMAYGYFDVVGYINSRIPIAGGYNINDGTLIPTTFQGRINGTDGNLTFANPAGPALPALRGAVALGNCVFGDQFHVIGGCSTNATAGDTISTDTQTSVYSIQISSAGFVGSWNTNPSLPAGGLAGMAAVKSGNYIFLLGGAAGTSTLTPVNGILVSALDGSNRTTTWAPALLG